MLLLLLVLLLLIPFLLHRFTYKIRICTRLLSESLSRAERIFVKEFVTIFSTAEGPIDYCSIVDYGLRRI
jgi:hypothetical protein